MGNDVEAVPIYRCDGKVLPPKRAYENHGLAIEHLLTWTENRCQATLKVISSSCARIIGKFVQNPGNTEMHVTSSARLRITPNAAPNVLMTHE